MKGHRILIKKFIGQDRQGEKKAYDDNDFKKR
jgi:hypothetical protein